MMNELTMEAATMSMKEEWEANVYLEDIQRHLENNAGEQHNPIVFWSVNALWITALITICVWFWKFNGSERLTRWTRESDLIFAERVYRRRQAEEEERKMPPEKRRALLKRAFRTNGVYMIVTANDLRSDDDTSSEFDVEKGVDSPASLDEAKSLDISSNASVEDKGLDTSPNASLDEAKSMDLSSHASVEEKGMDISSSPSEDDGIISVSTGRSNCGVLMIRHRANEDEEQQEQEQKHSVPNCCAVCLGSYRIGDHVVWSTNPNCSHAFHRDCVVDWLVKMQDGNPCPCCRQCFIDIPEQDTAPPKTVVNTMDFGVVSL